VWGHRDIGDIGRRDILDLIDSIADRGSVIMARRVQAYVHRLFRWAVGRGIIDANPATDLPKPGAETKRSRVLKDGELAAIWNAADEIGWPFGHAIRLLILTGARRKEIGQLKWSEISGNIIALSSARTKNAEPHTIPLSLAAIDVLQRVPHIAESQLIFTTNGTSSVSGWSKAKAKLDELSNVKGWRIHDLRRTVSTGMNELGTQPHIVEAVLGHTVKGVAGVYNRAKYEAAKRAALETWGAHVMAMIGSEDA